MGKFLIILWVCLGSLCFAEEDPQPNIGITYNFSGGRLGDNLLAYIHAKYISHVFHIPLLYKPFQFSDQLVMDKVERHWDPNERGIFPKEEVFNKNEDYGRYQERNALYQLGYFPDFKGEFGQTYNGPWFDMDWDAPGFLTELRKLIKPINPSKKFPTKKDSLNVAIHLRKGSGPDSVEMTRMYFLKFPPQEYYEDQLARLVKMFPNKKIYAYLFTDYPNPAELASRMAKKFRSLPITFGFRSSKDNLESVVLEDFFGMMQFDCIIRPEANISYIASRLGNFIVEIYPMHGYWSGDRKVIDQIGIVDKRK